MSDETERTAKDDFRVFTTANGKAALARLVREFDHPETFTPNERLSCFLQGQKSVITAIREALEDANLPSASAARRGTSGRRGAGKPARERGPADGPYFPQ